MLTEAEILSQHVDQLKIAKECCDRLKMNAVEISPRGFVYMQLIGANKKLDGTCRQLFHWRGDDARWIKLGSVYVRAMKVAARLMLKEQWAAFGALAQLYELGQRRVDELGTRPTGRSIDKFIVPGPIDTWFEPKHPLILQ